MLLLQQNEQANKILQQLQNDKSWEYIEFPKPGDANSIRTYIDSPKRNTLGVNKFEFAFFVNKKKRKLKGLVYFGKHVEGIDEST